MKMRLIHIALCVTLVFGNIFWVKSQEITSREERVKMVESLNQNDTLLNKSIVGVADKTHYNLDKLELPPLSYFLNAVNDNATVKKAGAAMAQAENELSLQKRDWWNWIRLHGSYSFGRYNVIGNNSDEYTPMYQTTMSNNQHSFIVGVDVSIPLGDIFNRKKKLKKYQYDIEQLKYAQEEIIEERKLRILEAYNQVTELLATIDAKAETAALYNAQMKISENNFIQGKVDIISLSLERQRRSNAVTSYAQAKIQLHNAITLLEMLTNIKIIQE